MVTPFFSIAIPVFNRRDFIVDAVNSVVNQSFSDYELIIVDNNSTDGTWEYLESIKSPSVRVYKNDENVGMVANWVKCIEYARGKWFKFLMSDDVFIVGSLQIEHNIILENKAINVFISKGCSIDNVVDCCSAQYNTAIVPISKIINQRKRYNYGEYTAMPNAYTLPTSDLKNLVKSSQFKLVLEKLGATGHVVDYYIFYKIALRYEFIIEENRYSYAVRNHQGQGSKIYNKFLYYHVRGDSFINNLLFNYKRFEKIYIFKHVVLNFYRKFKNIKSNSDRFKLFLELCKSIIVESVVIFKKKPLDGVGDE